MMIVIVIMVMIVVMVMVMVMIVIVIVIMVIAVVVPDGIAAAVPAIVGILHRALARAAVEPFLADMVAVAPAALIMLRIVAVLGRAGRRGVVVVAVAVAVVTAAIMVAIVAVPASVVAVVMAAASIVAIDMAVMAAAAVIAAPIAAADIAAAAIAFAAAIVAAAAAIAAAIAAEMVELDLRHRVERIEQHGARGRHARLSRHGERRDGKADGAEERGTCKREDVHRSTFQFWPGRGGSFAAAFRSEPS